MYQILAAGDFDTDGDIDCDDWVSFQFVWTDSAEIPLLPLCIAGVTPPGGASYEGNTSIIEAVPNPMGRATRIAYSIYGSDRVRLRIFDLRGRVIRTLADDTRDAGEYSDVWDGLNDRGEPVASGVYFCRLDAPEFKDSKRIVLAR